nr:hypothetical protein [Desulfobacula sp.]
MKRDFHSIKEAFRRLEKIHSRHLGSFDVEAMPDLGRQNLERKKEFDQFKEDMRQWLTINAPGMDTETQSMVQYMIDRIHRLLEQNKIMEKRVRRYKEDLQKKMKALSKGKQAISAYGSPPSILNRPRAINITTH